ncbi:MAG: phosphate acyltransferase PlsX, partial [Kiritimatiellia bacterium]
MRIALDAMGGDHAPYEVVWGGVEAAATTTDEIFLVGNEPEIRAALTKRHSKVRPVPDLQTLFASGRLSIIHTEESIAMDDAPAAAVRRKKNCSINICMRLVKEGKADAAVSAGNSGAMAASALFCLGRIRGVTRPAIATVLPTSIPGRPVLLLDAGANTDCHHEWLRQFAVMGEVYSRFVLGCEKPRVGLMSIGTEDCKGNEMTKRAFQLLRHYTPDIAFNGNVEGHDVFGGKIDVIVCDGFVGNVLLKTAESAAHAIAGWLKSTIKVNLWYKLAALMLLPALKKFKHQMNPDIYGGAPLLGVPGAVIITHGSSNYEAIAFACRAGSHAAANNVSSEIADRINALPEAPLDEELESAT